MSRGLVVYLNDHLAGSLAAIELLDHLGRQQSVVGREPLTRLRREIEEDQEVLRKLLQQLGGKESPVRKAAAWLAEKLGQAKLRFDDRGNGDLPELEALEALGLGIQGKLSLWRALATVSGRVPQLGMLDLSGLEKRAREQFDLVERLRLEAARAALLE